MIFIFFSLFSFHVMSPVVLFVCNYVFIYAAASVDQVSNDKQDVIVNSSWMFNNNTLFIYSFITDSVFSNHELHWKVFQALKRHITQTSHSNLYGVI